MENQESSQSNRVQTIIISVVAVALAVIIAVYLYTSWQKKDSVPSTTVDNATTTVTVGGVTFELPPGANVTVEPGNSTRSTTPAPDLDRSVVFPASFPVEAQNIWKERFTAVKAGLEKSPFSYDGWINAGNQWQMIGDYEGARLAWEYAAKLSPTTATAFGNLGFLYGYHLHDNSKAESNFKMALKNSPEQLYLYQQAFEFYRDVEKDSVKARALIEQGRAATGNQVFFDKLLSTIQ